MCTKNVLTIVDSIAPKKMAAQHQWFLWVPL